MKHKTKKLQLKNGKKLSLLSLLSLFGMLYSCAQSSKQQDVILDPKQSIVTFTESESLKGSSSKTQTELYLDSLGLIALKDIEPSIQIDLRYASTNNFTKTILYKDLNTLYLHPLAAQKLKKAQTILQEIHPELCLLVYDGARPLSVQRYMYNTVKNTKYRAYVANPLRTGLHNYGMAVDLTICDSTGIPIDMGTEFDYFGKLAGINNEDLFVSQGLLTKQQVTNRRLLRNVMIKAGYISIRGEWWHFNAISLSNAQKYAKLIE